MWPPFPTVGVAVTDVCARENEEGTAILNEVVSGAVSALFAAYNVDLRVRSAAPLGLGFAQVVSTIGFSSPGLTGSLSMAMSGALVEATYLGVDSAEVADWAGELANQLLGRVKNQLLDYGVEVTLALPMVLSGTFLSWPGTPRQYSSVFAFESDEGQVVVRLDAEMSADLAFVHGDSMAATRMDEGELWLF